MRAGTLVRVELIKSEDSKESRVRKGLPESEVYEGELVTDVKVGTRLWIDNSLRSSTIEMIDPVGPSTFHIKTTYSLYRLTLE